MFQTDLVQTPIDFCEEANIFEGHTRNRTFFCGPRINYDLFGIIYQRIMQSISGGLRIGFYLVRKLYWSWSNGPMAALQREWGNFSATVEKDDS